MELRIKNGVILIGDKDKMNPATKEELEYILHVLLENLSSK